MLLSSGSSLLVFRRPDLSQQRFVNVMCSRVMLLPRGLAPCEVQMCRHEVVADFFSQVALLPERHVNMSAQRRAFGGKGKTTLATACGGMAFTSDCFAGASCVAGLYLLT